ncbi:MAG: DUF4097 family beta strand repeat protein [Prolixibacteraceae bacterium]|nr:DUF4097 family beta strand repeat protein [Prolixibacteraceae bacterium]MBN2775533.1 DUF4097 family beta strand repeat protein [Prolixibacteraceae bacterium]
MKRFITITIFMLFTVITSFSQRIVNESVEVNGQEVKMKFDFADNITIEAWNKNTIELQVTVDIDDNTYNDYYSLEVTKGKNRIELIEDVDFEGIKEKTGKKNLCNFNTDLVYTLKVPENLKFDLNTISGEIELIGCLGEMDINTVSGFIDFSIPQSHKANIDLSTVTGDVYSNVKFDNGPSREISWVGTNQQLSLNGGEVDVELKTVSGDIFLRKK